MSINYKDRTILSMALLSSIQAHDFDTCLHLLTDTHNPLDIDYNNGQPLRKAIIENQPSIVELLLCSPEVKASQGKNATINIAGGIALRLASIYGSVELLEFIASQGGITTTSSSPARFTQDEVDESLCYSCRENCLQSLKYLLASPNLKLHGNIHHNDDQSFYYACSKGYVEIIEYLLVEAPIEINDNMIAIANAFAASKSIWEKTRFNELLPSGKTTAKKNKV